VAVDAALSAGAVAAAAGAAAAAAAVRRASGELAALRRLRYDFKKV